MIVSITGLRDIYDIDILEDAIKESGFDISTILSGGSSGIESLAEDWAIDHGANLIVLDCDWERYGTMAAIRKNGDLIASSDAAIVVWDGRRKEYEHFISLAESEKIPYHNVVLNN